jgi:hypothetical protein
LDRRFAADLAYLLDFEGPQQTAAILLQVATKVGFRGALENTVAQYVWQRHPGRRPALAVIVSEP